MKLTVYCHLAINKRNQAVNVNVSGYSHRKYCIGTSFTLNTPWQGEDPNTYKKDECVMAEFLKMKRDMNALDVTREEFMDAVWAVKERYKGIFKDGKTRKGSQKPARERRPKPTREKGPKEDRINLAMTLIGDFDPYAFKDDSRTTNKSDIYNSLGQPLMFRQNWKKAVALGHYHGTSDNYTAFIRRYAPDIENWKAIAENDKLRNLLEIFDSEPDEPDEKQYAPYVDPDDWEREMMMEIERIRQKKHTQNEKLHQVQQANTSNNEGR